MIYSYLEFASVTIATELYRHKCWNGVMSKDGHLLLSYEFRYGPYLYLLDLATGKKIQLFTIPNPIDYPFSCAIADSNAFIAAGCRKNIYLWNKISGTLMNTLVGHTDFVGHCVIIKNDSRIVSKSSGDVRVWKLESPQCDCLYKFQVSNVCELVVSLDNTRIFTTSWCKKIISIWDSETGECVKILEGHTENNGTRYCLAVSVDDDKCLGSVAWNGALNGETKLWNITTGKCTKTCSNLYRTYKYSLTFDIAYLSSTRLVWWIHNKEVGVYDLQKETNTCTFLLKVRFVSVSPDGKYLIIVHVDEDEKLLFTKVYSLKTGKLK